MINSPFNRQKRALLIGHCSILKIKYRNKIFFQMEKLDKKVILALGTIATSGALFYFYTKSRRLTTLDLKNPDKTVSLPLIKVIKISEDTRIFRYLFSSQILKE